MGALDGTLVGILVGDLVGDFDGGGVGGMIGLVGDDGAPVLKVYEADAPYDPPPCVMTTPFKYSLYDPGAWRPSS